MGPTSLCEMACDESVPMMFLLLDNSMLLDALSAATRFKLCGELRFVAVVLLFVRLINEPSRFDAFGFP